jgi:hypothetical protein
MSGRGKIARLPRGIREQICRRLDNGECGKEVLAWLNGLPEVKTVLAEKFGGRPVSQQNLCGWWGASGGAWRSRQEMVSQARELAGEHGELKEASGDVEVSDRVAGVLSVELAKLGRKLLAEKAGSAEQWRCLREVLRELSQLRRDDHSGTRLALERERRERRREKAGAEAPPAANPGQG